MATRLKTLTDAGYIAVGLGVMGVQQAQVRGAALSEPRDTDYVGGVRARPGAPVGARRSDRVTHAIRPVTQVRDAATRTKDLRDAGRQARGAGGRPGAVAARRAPGAGRAGHGADRRARARARRHLIARM